MQVEINQVKKGAFLEMDNGLYVVVDREHYKPGKGGALVRLKIKNLRLGTTIDETLKADEKVEMAFVEKKNMQFLYSSKDVYEFMDHDTYDQISLHKEQLSDVVGYLKENMEVSALVHKNKIITVELPLFVEMKIVSTEPGVKGDTAKAGTKPAKTETGMEIQVPIFVNEGDVVKIDTRTGEYVGRA